MIDESKVIHILEGEYARFPLTIEVNGHWLEVGGMIVGIKDGRAVILDIVVVDPMFSGMFPDHWMGVSLPRYEEEVVESTANPEA